MPIVPNSVIFVVLCYLPAGFMGVFGLTYKLQRTGCCWNQGALCYPCAVGELVCYCEVLGSGG